MLCDGAPCHSQTALVIPDIALAIEFYTLRSGILGLWEVEERDDSFRAML